MTDFKALVAKIADPEMACEVLDESCLDDVVAELEAGRLIRVRGDIDAWLEARKAWVTPGTVVSDEAGCLLIEGAQAHKGQPRRTVAVVEAGEYCVCTT